MHTLGELYVFISYARPDMAAAEAVEAALTAGGFRVFRDVRDIRAGDNWDLTIERALGECQRMVLLLSSASMPDRKERDRDLPAPASDPLAEFRHARIAEWSQPVMLASLRDAVGLSLGFRRYRCAQPPANRSEPSGFLLPHNLRDEPPGSCCRIT